MTTIFCERFPVGQTVGVSPAETVQNERERVAAEITHACGDQSCVIGKIGHDTGKRCRGYNEVCDGSLVISALRLAYSHAFIVYTRKFSLARCRTASRTATL